MFQAQASQRGAGGGERSSQGPRAGQLLWKPLHWFLSCKTPALPYTHPPPTAHSLIVGSHLSGGLTKRLFSKTLSLESESKSLQEARGWGEGGALSSGQGHGDRVTSGDDLIPTSLGLSRVRGGIRGLSRRKLR